MLKITALTLSLLTVMAIAPAARAATNVNPLSIHKPAVNLHSQVIIKIGGKAKSYSRAEAQRLRQLEREREAARRRRLRNR